MKDMHIYVRS